MCPSSFNKRKRKTTYTSFSCSRFSYDVVSGFEFVWLFCPMNSSPHAPLVLLLLCYSFCLAFPAGGAGAGIWRRTVSQTDLEQEVLGKDFWRG